MRIENHRLTGVPFQQAQWMGDQIVPEFVVLHDTASRLAPGAAASYLARNDAKVSVHFVVERDGQITQQVPVNRAAWHAGQSTWQGRSGCNGFSLGIEMVNAGRMTRASETMARAWWGELLSISLFGIEEVETRQHGHGLWMPYPEPQIGAVVSLLEALFRDIPTLTDITTHWYVSPGRKVDPTPLFPLDHVRARVLGRDDPADAATDAGSIAIRAGRFVRTVTPGDSLNLRRWPSFNPNILAAIPDGTLLPLVRQGVFAGRDWLCVEYGGRQGWVLAAYTADVTH